MAFPGSPLNGQVVIVNGISYTYNSVKNAWVRSASTSANVITTDTANIVSNLSSTSTTTGALKVAGGIGVQGNVFATAVYTNSYFYANGTAFAGGGGGGTGYTGSAGVGYTGSVGSTGYTGSAGTNGYTGSVGSIGYTGSFGSIGYTGSFGSTGYTGSFGSTGYVGSLGYTGSVGTGYAGSTGYTGSVGTGYTGSIGSQGSIGYTGSAGGGGGGGSGYTGSQGLPGTLVSGIKTDVFTGNGTVTTFTLSVAPISVDATIVNIDGVVQQRSSYTISGYTLTLSEALLTGETLEVTTVTYGTANFLTRNFTGNGSATTYTVTNGTTADGIFVSINGVMQRPTTDYTVSGTSLIFVEAPANGDIITVREIPSGGIGGTSIYSRTSITATAGQTSFAVVYSIGFLEVYFNGALLNSVDYTATTGSTVVLTDAAVAGDIVEFIAYNAVPVTAVSTATFNSTTLTANLAITAGYSAVSVGPISIASGVQVSIASGQKWVIL